MKRTRTVGDSTILFDANKDLSRAEEKLAEICFIVGLDGANLDSLTIDEIVEEIRKNFYYTSPVGIPSHAGLTWLRKTHFHVIGRARRYWWHRQLAKGSLKNG